MMRKIKRVCEVRNGAYGGPSFLGRVRDRKRVLVETLEGPKRLIDHISSRASSMDQLALRFDRAVRAYKWFTEFISGFL